MHELSTPHEWHLVKLSDILKTIENGSRPKGGVGQIRMGIPSIGGEHITLNGDFDFSDCRFVSESFFNSQKRGIVHQNDILIVKDGATTGKVAFVDKHFPFSKSIINEHVFVLRAHSHVDPKWLFYYIYSFYGQSQIKKSFHGMIGGINTKFIQDFHLLVPPIQVQKKIVLILDKVNELKQKRKKSIILTNQLIQSVFLKMFGDPATNPNGWKSSFLKDVMLENPQNGLFKKDDFYGRGTKIVWVENISNSCILEASNLRRVELTDKEKTQYKIQEGDVLVTRSSHLGINGVGIMNVASNLNEDTIFESHIMKLKPNSKCMNSYFLCTFFKTEYGRNMINRKAKRATMATINQPELLSLEVLVPPIKLQNNFESTVKKIESIRPKQPESDKKLQQCLESIMHKAFKGELVA